jgi:MFS family permease
MPARSRSIIVYSCLGHLYVHLCTAFYFVIVLALERAWQLPYHQLIGLWTLGSLMVGAVALPAGLISDRVGAPRMMVLYFLGVGACAIAAGLAATPTVLVVALTGMGIFAAIYHPVGVPWLVRNAGAARGKALGFNGVFGSMGTAGAGLTAGILIDVMSWRAAFILPGAVCALTGIALLAHMARGGVSDEVAGPAQADAASRDDMIRAFAILLVTMFIAGLVYHTIQTSLPKVPLKTVYLTAILVQVPAIWLAASLSGVPLVLIATFMVMSGAAQLPAENMLLARYTPARRHGLQWSNGGILLGVRRSHRRCVVGVRRRRLPAQCQSTHRIAGRHCVSERDSPITMN